MLNVQLVDAGFYEVCWPENEVAGATYVRPGRRESVRVFLHRDSPEVEVYTGELHGGKLVYRGPAEAAAQLRWLALRCN
ncbi:hypothetical protein [Hymenobacter sp. B81]|uniref:hypothetical protein n=1 Tax=Hymenobacter sp. B81 TaxID=3344878 RepID=UPI0037DC685E